MLVDHVVDDGDAALVSRIDQPAQAVRTAVAFLDREDVGGVVAPGDIAGEFVGRHELDRAHAEIAQVVELRD